MSDQRGLPSDPAPQRLDVRKTYKLFIGGAFPRSESGRSYPVTAPSGEVVHAAQASRKDVRDAVVAARGAFAKWSGSTAYNRGQVLYRIAEMLEGRREQFAAYTSEAEVDASIDRWVHYAGWADKYAQVAGSTNPVAGPYFTFSLPEPTGVVAVLAPQESSLLGLVSVLAPVLTTGNTAELAPWLAGHRDVNALDVTGAGPGARAELQAAAADNVKRVYVPRDSAGSTDWTREPGLSRLNAFVETKTVWHPIGV
jgi:hypothetical protein